VNKLFDTTNMLAMLTKQQGLEPFKGGQRISEDVAALLNGLPAVIGAIAVWQEGVQDAPGEDAMFAPRAGSPSSSAVAPGASDADLHTVSGDSAARLISAFSIDTATGKKKRIE
jgi:hypothetical protein